MFNNTNKSTQYKRILQDMPKETFCNKGSLDNRMKNNRDTSEKQEPSKKPPLPYRHPLILAVPDRSFSFVRSLLDHNDLAAPNTRNRYFRTNTTSRGLLIGHPSHTLSSGKSNTEAQVVVAVPGRVVVAVRHPAVPGIVVPAAAAVHAVGALLRIAVNMLCLSPLV